MSALLLGSIAGFLVHVPAVSWISCIVVLIGMILMFLLGVQTGARRIRLPRLRQPRAGVLLPEIGRATDRISLRRAG